MFSSLWEAFKRMRAKRTPVDMTRKSSLGLMVGSQIEIDAISYLNMEDWVAIDLPGDAVMHHTATITSVYTDKVAFRERNLFTINTRMPDTDFDIVLEVVEPSIKGDAPAITLWCVVDVFTASDIAEFNDWMNETKTQTVNPLDDYPEVEYKLDFSYTQPKDDHVSGILQERRYKRHIGEPASAVEMYQQTLTRDMRCIVSFGYPSINVKVSY